MKLYRSLFSDTTTIQSITEDTTEPSLKKKKRKKNKIKVK